MTTEIPQNLAEQMTAAAQRIDCDLLIVGGGINGCGIARDAAGRGLSVVLCEKDDLASHTSSASTKLIHGGLRYLEHNEFGLVRKALIEREILMRSAPHLIWPLQFVMPHAPGTGGQRPAWLIRAGLFLYDHLARRELLPASSAIALRSHAAGAPLKTDYARAFVYADGWVDDARLVVANAIDAAQHGAQILTRTRCQSLRRKDDRWHAKLQCLNGASIDVTARAVVNAAGPWAADLLQNIAHQSGDKTLRLIKGSHIVVRKLFDHPYAYLFQHADKRIIFAIPYEQEFTLIGTTDIDYRGEVDKVAIDASEVDYLCDLVNQYFARSITPADVVWSFSGVRPLVEEGDKSPIKKAQGASTVTRDYRFELEQNRAPLLSVFGGKITTFRVLAEEAMSLLCSLLSCDAKAWTAQSYLPGGALFGSAITNRGVTEFANYVQQKQRDYAWLPSALIARYVRGYGTRIDQLLAGRDAVAAMGDEIAPGLFAAEVDFLITHEWAVTAADILWRRTKLGLHLPADTETVLSAWMLAR